MQPIMLRKLIQLLLRGAVSVGATALAALFTACLLYLVAAHLQPKKQAATEARNGCVPSHCRLKVDAGH